MGRYDGEPDMSEEIEHAFAKFKQGAVKDYRVRFPEWADMNHVEAQILDLVARLHPETFSQLEQFCTRRQRYLDDTIGRFDREVQFYLAYLEYIAPLEASGLTFSLATCVGTVQGCSRQRSVRSGAGDEAVPDGSPVVCNDFHLTDPERILVVSGPNNGGKTTFARMFGQLHYLASLGLPGPG